MSCWTSKKSKLICSFKRNPIQPKSLLDIVGNWKPATRNDINQAKQFIKNALKQDLNQQK